MQKEYKNNVTIIAVSGETAEEVKPFVSSQGSKMEYTVAVDQAGQTNAAWKQAAGIDYIPYAFIVDGEGKIAWMGNPVDPATNFDGVLAKVAGGRYDPQLEKEAKPILDQLDWAVKMRDWQAFDNYTTQVLTLSPRIFNDVALRKFRVLLLDKKDVEGAIAYATGPFATMYADDTETLLQLAEMILTDSTVLKAAPDQLKPLALEVAETAAGSGNDPQALRVYAMALYHNGQVEKAIEVQTKAYFMVEPEFKDEFRRLLEQYKSGAARRSGR